MVQNLILILPRLNFRQMREMLGKGPDLPLLSLSGPWAHAFSSFIPIYDRFVISCSGNELLRLQLLQVHNTDLMDGIYFLHRSLNLLHRIILFRNALFQAV